MDHFEGSQNPILRTPTANQTAQAGNAGHGMALLVAVDSSVGITIEELLGSHGFTCACAKSIAEMKLISARQSISACFSGLWLVDGTYRDVVSQLRIHAPQVPVVIVCGADSPPEYRDLLSALKIQSFDCVCFPFQKSDLERALESAMGKSGKCKSLEASRSAPVASLAGHAA